MTVRTAIVTGAFGALGGAVASAFDAAGYKVARVDFAPKPQDSAATFFDVGQVDLTDISATHKMVASVVAALGSIDVLVNVAGGFTWQTLADGCSDTWRRMFELNTTTCVNMTKAALPDLEKAEQARIINVGAQGALIAAAGMGSYAASKMAVHKFTESLSAELAGKSITVNAVLPSIIDTPANRADMPDADFTQWVQPAAIADVILFLASPAARGISGALIPVTKGD